ncbi:MAG: oligoendopeptidase F [Myxococcota bacterium]|jgi:oligoendopeptidase F
MTAPTWNLEMIFPDGLQGDAFSSALSAAEAEARDLLASGDSLPALPEQLSVWVEWLLAADDATQRLWQCSTFSHCLTCADTNDRGAARAEARARAAFARLRRAWVGPENLIASGSEDGVEALLSRPEIAHMRPMLEKIRRNRRLLLPLSQQQLARELSEDGLQGWGNLYDRLSGQLEVEIDGERIAAGQANNRLGSTDRPERTAALAALGESWKAQEEHCAQALSHITGWRQVLNDRRGVDELADTLAANRMSRETLEAMMASAARQAPLLKRYMTAKAGLLGQEKLGWEDLSAPLANPNSAQSWEQSQAFILDHFASYHSDLADFAANAFDRRWIEGEDRPGKRQGGWCASVPLSGESRIFMTFGNTFRGTVTLAHELGHAYHNWVCRDLSPSQRQITSTLAETASVFAESLVRDAALKAADSRESRLAMLDARLMAGVSFLMNIPARYAFERALYPLRREGLLDPDVLTQTMLDCQKTAYQGHLESWYPHFWASKLHFFISGRAFYNYPYTFGYLFAQLVYRKVRADGDHAAYVALLRRTGWDDAEPLAAECLGLDLTRTETWDLAAAGLEEDLEAFLAEI